MKKLLIYIFILLGLFSLVSAINPNEYLTGHYSFDTNINDDLGNYTSTAQNGATLSTSQSKLGGQSMFFDGDNDYLDLGNVYIPADNEFYVSMWVRESAVTALDSISDLLYTQYDVGQDGRTANGFRNGGKINYFNYESTTLYGTTANEWHHVAFARDGPNFLFYYDGVLEENHSTAFSIYQGDNTELGGTDDFAQSWYGYIDEVTFYSGLNYTGQEYQDLTDILYNESSGVSYPFPVESTTPTITFDNISLVNNTWFNDDFDINITLINSSTNGNINTSYILTETFNNPQYFNNNISYQSVTPFYTDISKTTANQFCVENNYDSATITSNIANTGSAKYYTGSAWANVTINARNYDSITCKREVQIGTNTLNPNTTINVSSLSEGNYSIYLNASNNETSTLSSLYSFGVDKTPTNIIKQNNLTSGSFEQNFSNIINFSDNLSGVASCFLNITELENVTSPDNFYINCTDTQVFTSNGLHNFYAIVTDNAGNINSLSFNDTIQTFVYVNFLDKSLSNISNYSASILHPDTRVVNYVNQNNPLNLSPVNNGVLDLGNHSITFTKTGYLTQTFVININETSGGQTYNLTISDARILLYIRDQETGNIITGKTFNVDFIATVGANVNTSTGLVNISNTFFLDETYLAVVSNDDYQTETISFDFSNREIITLNAYMIESNNSNLGVVFIKPVDNFGNPIVGSNVKALQWDTNTSSYIEVSSAITGSDGLGTLNVILNDKVYIFTASYEGVSSNTTSEIIDSTENGKTITIKITGISQEYSYLLENVITSVTESFNDVTNISTITFNYESSIGAIDVCINSYRVLRGSENLLTENCISGTSGSYILEFNINNSYLTVLKAIIEIDDIPYTIRSFEYQPQGSFSGIMEDLGFSIFIVPLLFLGAISLAMIIENVYIGTFLLMIMGGLSLTLAPTILTKGIVGFLFFMGWITINYGVKSK